MCDNELLLSYLYDELPPADRQAFDRHLASCADCRDEVEGLRSTRTHLASWTPPAPDLGLHAVRGATAGPVAAPARWWQSVPAWGLAAAALLTIAVSAAVANVEVRFASDGVVVRTGWAKAVEGQVKVPQSVSTSPADISRLEARMKELEGQLASRQPAALVPTVSGRVSDAEITRYVRQQVSESERRLLGELATRILQVSRDTETARRTDIDRLLTAYRELQGTSYQTFQRQKALEDHVMRVGLQR
jgi:hypothetical protein